MAGEGPFLRACRGCLNPFLMVSSADGPTAQRLEQTLDIREDVAPGSVLARVLASFGKELDSLPVLPEIPQRILAMVHDPLASMSELAQVAGKDAVISVKVLKMANSAFYMSAQEIRDLNVACARLGLRTIANVVHAVANANLYRTANPAFREMMQSLWQHSLAVAHCTEELGARVGGVDKSVLFEAGLVHDIGRVVLLDLITVKYKGNVGRLRQSPQLLRRVIDKYHALVGLHVAQHWNVGADICFSTFFHDIPDACPAGEVTRLVDLVAVANRMAHVIGYGVGAGEVPAFDILPAVQRLGKAAEDLQSMCEEAKSRVDEVINILGAL